MTTPIALPIVAYLPAGSSIGPFAIPFGYADPSEIVVKYVPLMAGLASTGPSTMIFNQPGDFTVTDNPGGSLENGGSITVNALSVPAGGWQGDGLAIYRRTPKEQPTSLTDQEGFQPETQEVSLDLLTRITQDLFAQSRLAVIVPPDEFGLDLPSKAARASAVLGFTSLADGARPVPAFPGGSMLTKGDKGDKGAKGDPGAGTLGFTPLNKAGDTATDLTVNDGATTPATFSVGMRGVPVNEQDGAYTFVATDDGKMVRQASAANRVYTLQPVATVPWPSGAIIVARNFSAFSVTILRGAGVVIHIMGSGVNQDVTIGPYGGCVLVREAGDAWFAAGAPLS